MPKRKRQLREVTNIEEFEFRNDSLTLEDVQILTKQLERVPENVYSVVWRNEDGEPGVIKCYPVLRAGKDNSLKPFPTLYWLTCPKLGKRISVLEERGWIGRMNDQIEESETYQHLLSTSHEMYARERWELLDEETKREVEGGSVGWPVERLRDSGVSGMTSRRGKWTHDLLTGGEEISDWIEEEKDEEINHQTMKENTQEEEEPAQKKQKTIPNEDDENKEHK